MLTLNHTRVETPKPIQPVHFENIPFFKALRPVQKAELGNALVLGRFGPGDFIYREGEPASLFWFLKDGLVSLVKYVDVEEKKLGLLVPGNMFGTLVHPHGRVHLTSAAAWRETWAYSLPRETLYYLMERCPELAGNVLEQFSRQLAEAQEMAVFGYQSVERRILKVLTRLAGVLGKTIRITRQELADMANTRVETCIRTITRLERDGLVRTGHGKVTLADFRGALARRDGFGEALS